MKRRKRCTESPAVSASSRNRRLLLPPRCGLRGGLQSLFWPSGRRRRAAAPRYACHAAGSGVLFQLLQLGAREFIVRVLHNHCKFGRALLFVVSKFLLFSVGSLWLNFYLFFRVGWLNNLILSNGTLFFCARPPRDSKTSSCQVACLPAYSCEIGHRKGENTQ